ncbi:hypothetical protein EV182_003086 [Spiromyces aspiralis]|uniref:Uncharacterized protein n=1 Tax=Spiromyces aspiralis TaxID=68401 RepID=A0ACC1HEV5_9FUNG|nr:hypothetical protein EV182_003086 [Spiromyces aspiralis]
MVRVKWGSREHWRAAHSADRIMAYTDRSVKQKKTTASMGFRGVIISEHQGEEVGRLEFSGATRDGPFSSTAAELLAIVVAVTLVPRGKDIHVKTDSRAATVCIKVLQQEDPKRRTEKGSMAYLGCWCWLCIGSNTVPKSAGRMCREQEEGWVAKQFIEQVKSTHRGVKFGEEEIEVALKVANGAVDKEGQVIYKNSWRVMSEHDMQVRSFTIKALLGYLPVMKHEVAWYPLVYPKPKITKCPRCEHEEEMQAHFFKCKQGDPKRGEKGWGSRETKMVTEKYLDS